MSERDIYVEAGVVTADEAREIAARYNASHWRNARAGECARYTIPADPQRDDDIRLEAFIRRAEMAFAELELLERIRAHAACKTIVLGLQGDAEWWRLNGPYVEREPGDVTPAELAEAHDLVAELLGGDK